MANNLRLSSYVWPHDINQCALTSNLTHICPRSGYSFEPLYYILQYLNKPFNITELPGTYISNAQGSVIYDTELSIASGKADVIPPSDVMNREFIRLNMTYLEQPIINDHVTVLVNTNTKMIHGGLFAPFKLHVWILIFCTYVTVGLFVVVGLFGWRNASQIYRLSFDQKNYGRVWTAVSRRLFITCWAMYTALLFKHYRSQILRNLVVLPAPVIPELAVAEPAFARMFMDQRPYKLVVGISENELGFIRMLVPKLADRVDEGIKVGVVEIVNSSGEYVASTTGSFSFSFEKFSELISQENDGVCSFKVDDSPFLPHGVPISTSIGGRIQRKMSKAGFAFSELGFGDFSARKYYPQFPVKRECQPVPRVSDEWRALDIKTIRTLIIFIIFSHVLSTMVALTELLSGKVLTHCTGPTLYWVN